MHKRLMAVVAVLALGIATVLWVSANPQEKTLVKPAAVRSGGSCCPHEGASKAVTAQAKSDVKPASVKEGECPHMAGETKAKATNGKKDCSDCPEMKAAPAVKDSNKTHGGCPFMKSHGTAAAAKTKSAPAKPATKATETTKKAKSL